MFLDEVKSWNKHNGKLGNNLVEYPSIKNVQTGIDCKVSPLYYQIRIPSSQGCININGSFLVKDKPLLLVIQCQLYSI